MKFGATAVEDALGAILAHGITVNDTKLKKGRVLSADDLTVLSEAGIGKVVVAQLEEGDLGEDECANRIAGRLTGDNLSASAAFTGRVNLYAATQGVAVYDRQAIDRLNCIDEAVTLATLPPFSAVENGQMVATVKIIPFAVPERVIAECLSQIAEPLRVAPFAAGKVALIQTLLPGTREKVLNKTSDVIRHRIEGVAGQLVGEIRCGHNSAEIAEGIEQWHERGCDMVLISGASAITDRRDVVPAAIEAIGGTIDHFGMPVDPGNLMLVGHVGGTLVLGLPGCARSPKVNGFDWILQRLAAGLTVTSEEIMRMGSGGLLSEIDLRPLPRAEAGRQSEIESPPARPAIGAVILAAGQSRRMGKSNKLLADIEGKPMVSHVADAVLESQARPAVVVLGHQASSVRKALSGRDVEFVHNADFAEGISSSLKKGLQALPPDIDGALICLGDMPRVTAAQIDRLIASFNPVEGRAICVPTFNGKRGNPVLFAKRFFESMESISGDVGARHLIGEATDQVCEVEMKDRSVLFDIDTRETLEKAKN